MAAQFDAVAELTSSFKLLFQKRNWMLALPILISLIAAGIIIAIGFIVAFGSLIFGGGLAGAIAGSSESGRAGAGMIGLLFSGLGILFCLFIIIGIIIAVFGYAWTYGAAEPVWQGGDPDIGGGFGKATSKLGSIFLLALIVGIVTGLLFWTIIVPILVGIFCLYTIPYVMQGNQSGPGSIAASINLVKDNFGPSGMLFLGLLVVGIAAGIINAILGIIPLLGHIAAILVQSLVGAFTILAVMRFYNLLAGTPATARTPAAPTTPTS